MDDMAAADAGAAAGRDRAGFDPRISLATSVHSAPGVYALLLGAGVSIGAGIMTGWGMVEDLVSRAAVAQQPDDPNAGTGAAANPEKWWDAHGTGKLGYSALLAQVAPAPGARQAILRAYFEPKPDEAGEITAVAPGAAHRAIAQLVLRNSIKVILTTNFDRLTERALEEVGIAPEVIHSPAQFSAATPLAHSRVTVIKLHGDYLDLEQRNTVDELADYPEAQQQFLERIADEYGLIVCGWSADWDKALVGTLERVRSRRYPMFWSHLSPLGEAARSLTAQHKATLIPGATADAFFEDLLRRLEALDSMSEPPLSREMAVSRFKRALPSPERRIELHDLVEQTLRRVEDSVTPERYPITLPETSFEESVDRYRADTDTLMHLVATGVFHDGGAETLRWVKVIQRLSRLRRPFGGFSSGEVESLRHYPALLVTWCAGVAAILAAREEALYPLLMQPRWSSPYGQQIQFPAAIYLSPFRLLDLEGSREFCARNGLGPDYAQSHLIREQGREALYVIESDAEAYQGACDRLEFLASMISMDATPENADVAPWHGEFVLHDFMGLAARIAAEIAPGWPLLEAGAFGGDVERAQAACAKVINWVRAALQLPRSRLR